MIYKHFLSAAALVLCSAPIVAAPAGDSLDRDYGGELTRPQAVEPADALGTFTVQPGYRMELVAAEPLVRDPTALAFDEAGGVYVVEMRGYSEQRKEHLSSIRRLTDEDGDGVFDAFTTLVDKLEWPTAIACWEGGVFVANPPQLLYFKDTDGDGGADIREVVYDGFGTSNVQGLMNTLLWGLDNRYHGATSASGAEVVRPDAPGKPLSLRGRDFAFDPRSRTIAPISGGGQHGATFDAWGRRFVCSNSDHIILLMFDDHYAARNPWLAAPGASISIAADGPAGDVFRRSPVEAWREVRTRLRVQGLVPGPIEGGGRASGYFTSATGVTVYGGDTWPEADRGLAIVADVGSNLIHRKRLEANGLELIARRIDKQSEFIASTDNWFRPVQFCNGPDGNLYVADMYREVIEHPDSLPPIIKKHLDLNSGNDRGRIYRIVPEDYAQRPWPKLADASTQELVDALSSLNVWHRSTASRLIYTRQLKEAIPALRAVALGDGPPLGRLHALYALDGLAALEEDVLLAALGAETPPLRAHALRLSEPLAKTSSVLQSAMTALQQDADPMVRYQLAFSLGALPGEQRAPVALALAQTGVGDRWMRFALLSSLDEGSDAVLAALGADTAFQALEGATPFLHDLGLIAGATADPVALPMLMAALSPLAESNPGLHGEIRNGLVEGANNANRGGAILDVVGNDGAGRSGMQQQALETALAADAPEDIRLQAIRALGMSSFEFAGAGLSGLLAPEQPAAIQTAAIQSLRRFDTFDAARPVVAHWNAFSPQVRSAATEMLFARPNFLMVLLDAVEKGHFKPTQLESTRIAQLRAHPDAATREHALRVLPPEQALARRADVVEAYQGALSLQGDPKAGMAQFKMHCAQCHKIGDMGFVVGPDLANIGNSGADKILVNILDPNREVNPQYLNYVIETKDWQTYSGIIASETATSISVARANGLNDTILRNNIESIKSAELSLMPEGWEVALKPQGVADIIAYLMSLTGGAQP